MDFNHIEVEQRWKKYWADKQVYKVTEDTSKPKYYILDMFPYPSGAGLHVGHPLGYIASDIVSRYKRLKGYNVLHPMGYDAFGLPAEQYAIQTGVHPEKSTNDNIAQYRQQLDNIGLNYDWSREVRTCDPSYYKWTQWIFIQLFEHYYDSKAATAKPITELVTVFELSGNKAVSAATTQDTIFSAQDWQAMSAIEKDQMLMNYRLAYRKTGYVNWCEALGTVLANDEVKDGLSERGGHPVERRAMMQWSLRITAYAERLLKDMEPLDWSDALKTMQSNWIGRSEGAQMFFDIEESAAKIEIFTTRPDTIFGATYMVLAPEHDLVYSLTTEGQRDAIQACLEEVMTKSERERMAEVKDMTGAFTGSYAVNPFNGARIPIWIGDYVLKDYGTGAIMAVPSDDDRDANFAKKYHLPFVDVVDKTDFPSASLHDKLGKIINSDFLNGMDVIPAINLMFDKIEAMGIGSKKVNYKLRDANFSRQRYWGEPFPIRYNKDGVSSAFKLEELPLTLPSLDDFKPTADGKSPLAKATDWVLQHDHIIETDTMPGFAGSSWYFIRYMDAHNSEKLASDEAISYWKDVDFYIGGAEHAVGHLMYSRFWHKFLYDKGIVPTAEPFKKLVNQGMIQGVIESLFLSKNDDGTNTFISSDMVKGNEDNYAKIPVHIDYVSQYGSPESHLSMTGIQQFVRWRPDFDKATFKTTSGVYTIDKVPQDEKFYTFSEVGKMSKRYFNVVNPDDVVEKYGADCFRMYEMFLGPIEQSKPWDTKGIDGVAKFLRKFYNLCHVDGRLKLSEESPSKEELKAVHTAIKKVSDDIEKLSLNTCISALMICVNELHRLSCNKREVIDTMTRLIAPFAPFMAEELWHELGNNSSVHHTTYPLYEASHLTEDEIMYPLCINGKKRDELMVDAKATPEELEQIVKQMDLSKWLEGNTIKKIIIVPNRMINLVV